ncbi:MAG: cardiolipin synthase ClsB [Betaproteobacteria bacterium]|nr:MAG: cardiolipin synthase ClsB [Betaproteobacteria bacterium]
MSTAFLPGNQIALLRSGAEYFPSLIAAINGAKSHVRFETYIFADDETGRAVTAAMIAAVTRGVEVRLVIDGFGCKDHIGSLQNTLQLAGVDVAVFRPERNPFAFRKSRLRRMHRKLVVVDDRVAFVGGINVIDDLNMPPVEANEKPYGPRFDFAVRIEGALIAPISLSMRILWKRLMRRRRSETLPLKSAVQHAASTTDSASDLTNEKSQLAAFIQRDNLLHRRDIEVQYLQAINSATQHITIANAYFFPGRAFHRALAAARRRGVRVQLLLQGRQEYFLQHYASRALYPSLLRTGIEIHEYKDSFLHAKVAAVDEDWATVGSSNIDPFSLLLAREANVFVRDAAFNAELRGALAAAIDGAVMVHSKRWSKRPWLDKLLTSVAYQIARGLMRVLGYGNR